MRTRGPSYFSSYIVRLIIAGFILFVVTGAPAMARAIMEKAVPTYEGLGSAAAKVPFLEEIRTGVLENGLRYYLRENHKPEGRAFLRIAVNAGSVLETDEERGLAHFVEHMAFNGTAHFPKSDLVDYLRSLGMRFGPEINAYTSFDETVYGIEVPIERDLQGHAVVPPKALRVIDDWSRAVSFLPDDVDAERPVIQEEYRSGLGAMDRIQRKILPVLFEGSPYAERLPIGDIEVVKTAPAERLANFYKTWYRPDNMALIFVGDFDLDTMEASLHQYFKAPACPDTINRPFYELPEPVSGRFSVTKATDPELSYGFVHLYYKRSPAGIGTHLGSYRDGLLAVLIDRILSARFEVAATVPETPYAAAGSGTERYGKESLFYVMSAIPEPGSVEQTIEALFREVESIRRYGFSQAEVDRAMASLLSDLDAIAAEVDKSESSSLADELIRHYLTGEVIPGIQWEARAARILLKGLTVEELSLVGSDMFATDDLTVFLIAPESEAGALPSEERVAQLRKTVASADIAPPADDRLEGDLLTIAPTPGVIVKESTDQSSETIVWDLANGAKIILKPTTNRNDEIILQASARGGTTSASDAVSVSATLASSMLSVSGIGSYSAANLAKILAGKQAGLSLGISEYLRNLNGAATTKDIKTLFELIYLTFSAPRIDEGAVAAMMDQVRTVLLQRRESPDAVFSDTVTTTMTGGHPRFAPLTVERLAEVDLSQVRAFLADALNISDFTFIFAGNVDPVIIKPLAETYIASLSGTERDRSWKDLNIRRPGETTVTVQKGKEAKDYVYLAWYNDQSYSEENAVAAAALEEYLDIRMIEEIREKLGGVYSVSSSVRQTIAPKGEISVSVAFVCDPERADELAAAASEEVEVVAQGIIQPEVYAKAVEALRKSYEEGIQNNRYIASSLINLAVSMESPLATLYARPTVYDKLMPSDLVALASKLLEHGRARVTLIPDTSAGN